MAVQWIGQTSNTVFACEKPNCYYRVSLVSGKATADHKCPHIGPTHFGWSITVTLVQKMWKLLDETMDELMDDKIKDKSFSKIRARAQAEMIAIFMVPHFKTADEVAREAGRRYRARQPGKTFDEKYETAGLGSLAYAPPPGEDKYKPTQRVQSKPAAKVAPVKRAPAKVMLSDKEKIAIKFAISSGMFTPAELATTYGVTVEAINITAAI